MSDVETVARVPILGGGRMNTVGISDTIRNRMLNDPAVADPSRGVVALEGSAPMTVEERFWAKVERAEGRGCWLWTGSRITRGGHGRFVPDGRRPVPFDGRRRAAPNVLAHRFSWELAYGPVPAGLEVMHACDNGRCVRPDHLMVGSHRANMVDAGRKGRTRTDKDATHCKRGHPFEGNTYVDPGRGRRNCHQCRLDRGRSS